MNQVEVDRGPPGATQFNAYAQKLKYTKRSIEKLRKNALEVYIVRETNVNVKLDFDFIVKVMEAVGVKNGIETQGSQAYLRGEGLVVEIWLLKNIRAARFCREAVQQLADGVNIIRVKPAMETQCTITVLGMPF